MHVLSSPRSRRRGSVLLAAAVVPVLLSACGGGSDSGSSGGTSADGITTIQTVTMSITGTHWREFVAEAQGYYADEGLKVEETVVKPNITVDSLLSGSAQIAFGDAGTAFQADERGADLALVGQGMDKQNYSLITAKDVTSVADLKGKTVGASAEIDVYTQVLKDILSDNGVDPADVNFVFGQGSNDRVGALQGGAIQGSLLPPPADARLEAEGYNVLAQTKDIIPEMTQSATIVSRKWAEENPDTVKAYLKAISSATDWLNDPANKDAAIQLLAEKTESSVDDAASAYEDYVAAGAFTAGACVQPDAVQELVDRLHDLDLIKETDAAAYIDDQYCPAA